MKKLTKLVVKLFKEELRDIDLPVIKDLNFVVETHEVDIEVIEDTTTIINVPSEHGTPIKMELFLHSEGIDITYDDSKQYWRIERIEVTD